MKKEAPPIVTRWNNVINLPGLLLSLGEDLERRELSETPERMHNAWREQLEGYTIDPDEVLKKTWPNEGGGIILCRDIFFVSLCEHHLLSFFGHCNIAYEPTETGEVVGLSKLTRLVDCFAHRLQIQERLVNQIADALDKHLDTKGIAVVAQGQHLCCLGRGIRRESMGMTTIARRGKTGNDLVELIR